jgi:NTP pyrophosphatase (non-canonical NTP hydrolase)
MNTAIKVINRLTRGDYIDFLKVVNDQPDNALDMYQRVATGSAIYPGQGTPMGLVYVALKGAGEAGEFAEHVGKAMRDDDFVNFETVFEVDKEGHRWPKIQTAGQLTSERRALLIKEIGDQLWYLSAKCNELGINLSDAAAINLEKLVDRAERNALQGSGDER